MSLQSVPELVLFAPSLDQGSQVSLYRGTPPSVTLARTHAQVCMGTFVETTPRTSCLLRHTQVVLMPAYTTAVQNQLWQRRSDGAITLGSRTGKCLEVADGSAAVGALLVVGDCPGGFWIQRNACFFACIVPTYLNPARMLEFQF